MTVPEEVLKLAEDIKNMRIRGAGEIARAAVRGLSIAAAKSEATNREEFLRDLDDAAKVLLLTRPTAVSLPNALRYVMVRAYKAYEEGRTKDEIKESVFKASDEFYKNSLKAIDLIGMYGSRRIEDGDIIMTHCHSTAAVSIIVNAWRSGKRFEVISTETRPRYQGRITASILAKEGIPVSLIVDSAARFFMEHVDKVVVGADAVAANGAVVNKIGTSMIALAAHEARVNFIVAAETYKFSPETVLGSLIRIEERPADEIVETQYLKDNPGVKVRNPAFDVTPASYVDLIVTEKGVIPPEAAILILKEEFGWFSSVNLPKFLKEGLETPVEMSEY
jgi:ribose 1,5-bisphosphate isomerase